MRLLPGHFGLIGHYDLTLIFRPCLGGAPTGVAVDVPVPIPGNRRQRLHVGPAAAVHGSLHEPEGPLLAPNNVLLDAPVLVPYRHLPPRS